MINLKSVADKIREGVPEFLSVGDSLSAADAVTTFTARPPACYVSTSGERARGNELSTGHRQRVIQTVSVLFVLGAERRDRQEADQVEAIKAALVKLLTAWTPEGAASPFEYGSYSLRFAGEGLAWGELLFAAPYYISQLPAG